MTDISEQLAEFQKKHPILSLLGFAGGAVIAKKEYDKRYHSKGKPKEDKE